MTTARPESPLRHMPGEEFVRRLRDEAGQPDVHYAFWLGAGCSITSGIPAAGSLVKDHWLPKLCKLRGGDLSDLDTWGAANFEDYDPEDPAAVYGPVMEQLFLQAGARQREVERLCSRGKPGFGYAVLATLLSRDDGMFNVALTTNFDDLIADAMYVFGPDESRPLVIPDEALARYIRPSRTRPLVVKVHGDFRLSPRNTAKETEVLKQGISEGIGDLLHDRGAIFVGYGGNDQGIAEVFKTLPDEALPHGIWWASSKEPHGALREWLEVRRAVWVEVPGFDELMLLFKSEFEIPNPNSAKFDQLFEGYLSTYKELQSSVERIPPTDPSAGSLRDAAERVGSLSKDWTAQYFAASRLEEDDPDEAEKLLRTAIAQNPQVVRLRAALAGILLRRARYDEGLIVARKAFDLEPASAPVAHLYALALTTIGQRDEALEVLRSAVDLDPTYSGVRLSYGFYLARGGRTVEAEEELDVVLRTGLVSPEERSMAASLLAELGRHEEAALLWEQVIEELPSRAGTRSEFARTLIALGRFADAQTEIETGFRFLTAVSVGDRLELTFYRWALAEDDETRALSLREIKVLVSEGVRLPDWGLTVVVRFVEEGGGPEAEWASVLADVLGGQRDVAALDSWTDWSEA